MVDEAQISTEGYGSSLVASIQLPSSMEGSSLSKLELSESMELSESRSLES